jgi:hypothetical protein
MLSIDHVSDSLATSCSQDRSRYALNFALVDREKNRVLSTDGHRLHSFGLGPLRFEGGEPGPLFIPAPDLRALAWFAAKHELDSLTVDLTDPAQIVPYRFIYERGTPVLADGIYGDDSLCPEFMAPVRDSSGRANLGAARLGVRRIGVRFPEYQFLFDRKDDFGTFPLSRGPLLRSLSWLRRHAASFARFHGVKSKGCNLAVRIDFTPGLLRLTAGVIDDRHRDVPGTTTLGIAHGARTCLRETSVLVNIDYFRQAVLAVGGDTVILSPGESCEPLEVRSFLGENRAFVMPVRLGTAPWQTAKSEPVFMAERVIWK